MTLAFDLLALDVDGTLLDETGTLSPQLERELQRARRRGVRLCLCTGRPYTSIQPLIRRLEIHTPPIVFNGALVPCLSSSAQLVFQPLAPTAVRQLISLAHETGYYLELHTATQCYIERLGDEGEWQRQKLGIEPFVGPFDGIDTGQDILKGQFVIRDAAQRQRLLDLEQGLDGAAFSWGLSPGFAGHFVNVMRPGIDKASSLDVLLRALDIPWSRVFAAGDSPSDLAYARRAGRGIMLSTMAHPATKVQWSETDLIYHAPPVQHNGLVEAMQMLFWSDGTGATVEGVR